MPNALRYWAARTTMPALAIAFILMVIRSVSPGVWDSSPLGLRLGFSLIVAGALAFAIFGALQQPVGSRARTTTFWLAGLLSFGVIGYVSIDFDAERVSRAPVYADTRMSDSPETIILERGSNGHFFITVSTLRGDVVFLVDTGATGVALSVEDARRFGINIDKLEYFVPVGTADGEAFGAPAFIRELRLENQSFQNVPVLVMRNGDTSLLGMEVLNQFSSIEMRGNRLYLNP